MEKRLKIGDNYVDGVKVTVVRRRGRRINLRVLPDGTVRLMVPFWWATLAQGAEFLSANWGWAMRMRERALANPPPKPVEATADQLRQLAATLDGLNREWCIRLCEADVTWKLRRMKSRWGTCHFTKRHVNYSTMLAGKPRELVEYVVVHELTHLKAHGHGAPFQRLMDARLPGWRALRRQLNSRARQA